MILKKSRRRARGPIAMNINPFQAQNGQSFLEFSFAICLVVLLLAGMTRVFLWTGEDLAQQRQRHEDVLMQPCFTLEKLGSCAYWQLNPTYYELQGIGATVNSNIFE